jgi:hypothetical protein
VATVLAPWLDLFSTSSTVWQAVEVCCQVRAMIIYQRLLPLH